MPKFVKYGFGAIAVYLVVKNFSGTSSVLSSGTTGGAKIIQAFQGR